MKKITIVLLMLTLALTARAQNFISEGNGIRNTIAGEIERKPVLFISEIDGAISCYSLDGKKKWHHVSEAPAVMFEIVAEDVNGDGNDDLLAASGDGHIYCWNSNGKLLWKFNPGHRVRFSEVAVWKSGDQVQVFAGGNDGKLYEVDAKGKLVSQTKIEGIIRKIEVGNFITEGSPSIFLMTYSHDKFRWEFMGFLDPKTKAVQKSLPYKNNKKNSLGKGRLMITDISVADINADNLDDLLFFGTDREALFKALDGNFNEIASFTGPKKDNQRYVHTTGTSLLPVRNEIALQFGSVLYVCNTKGELLNKTGQKYRGIIYNDLVLEPQSKQLIGAGQVGGGNGLYAYPLKNTTWWQTEHQLQGRMAEVEKNLETLYSQTLDFKLPNYQQPSEKTFTMITSIKPATEVKKLKGGDIQFVKQETWAEDFDRSKIAETIGDAAFKKDRRKKYNLSQKDIVAKAEAYEKQGISFVLWAGHGTDPFYLSVETMEAILEAAPNSCYGFLYAEMHGDDDPRVDYFIDYYIPRMAKACRRSGKAKIYFRNKNVFWAATSHMAPWKKVFFSGQYSDVLIPATEDTSSRTQDINISGRVGMFVGGYVDDFGMRLVDDNPTSWRPYAPGGQRSVSPYLRNGVLLAAYGARYGILINNKYLENPGLNIMFALMKSGVLPVVEKEDIVSIGSWHLVKDADFDLIHSINDHHNLNPANPTDEDAVFSLAQMNWAGAAIPVYDYSHAALGVTYRWLNFIPELPNGMVPIAPIDYAETLEMQDIPYSVSNGKAGFVDGKTVPANEFGEILRATSKVGGQKLPMVVSGASWSAIRLDENHLRLVLIDPGYIDPQERSVVVSFQNDMPKEAKDILSGEVISIKKASLLLTVPAGSMRFIDLTY